MPEVIQVVVQATGGWKFHFGVTEQQAEALVHASPGETISLSGKGETVMVYEDTMLHYEQKPNNTASSEELDRRSVVSELKKLISRGAWSEEEE